MYHEEEQELGSSLAVYDRIAPYRHTGTEVPVEMVGQTSSQLASSLVMMENSLKEGQKARVQLMATELASQEDLNIFYSRMLAGGFHVSKPKARVVEGIPSVEFTLRKGSPLWAALIPLIPTAIIGGLIAFGITRIEALSRALLPLMLVTIGGIVVIVAMVTRKPVLETARAFKRLPQTIPATAKKA